MNDDSTTAATPEALLKRLEWTVLRRLDGLLQGDHRTLFRGGGLDLADLREYQHGDDVRHIDWNVTARLQLTHVRQYTEDRELTAWFLLDLSGSVDFGSAGRTKLNVSEGFAAALARLLTRHGNRVGALFYGAGEPGRRTSALPPAVGRLQVLQLLRCMREQAQRASLAAGARTRRRGAAAPATQLAELLRAADATLRRRSLVFVLSDFISEPGWEAPLGRLAQRHEVVAVRLYDALEMQLPDLGLVTLEDAETGEQCFVDTHDPAFRARHAELAAQQEAQLRLSLARAGVDTLELATDDELLGALLRFVALRRQRLRLNAGRALPAHLSSNVPPGAAAETTTAEARDEVPVA